MNGVLLDCRSDSSACPLTHGALLQIGDAVLRLQVFKAMDHTTVRPVRQETAPPVPDDTGVPPVVQAGMFVPPMISDGMPVTPPCPAHSPVGPAFAPAVPQSADPAEPVPVPVPPVSSPRRADRWKEDWGE